MAKKAIKINHLAIIPDGNRRWAKENKIFDEEKTYQKGADRIKEVMETATEYEIKFLTLWASSLSNLRKRSRSFRRIMNFFYAKNFDDLAKSQIIREKKVRIQVFGEWEENLNQTAIEAIKNLVKITAKNNERFFTILVGYDGKRERGAAVIKLVNDLLTSRLMPPQSINEAELELRKRAWTGYLPNVDLLIRTGSWEDPHLSADFLTFLIGESQLAFPQVLWPDFSIEKLYEVLAVYGKKKRRFGE